MQELAKELLAKIDADNQPWKYPWMKSICRLAVEYLTLDGLPDAFRASEIPDEITDIIDRLSDDLK